MHSGLDPRAAAWRRLAAGAVLLGAGLAAQAAIGAADAASAPRAASAAAPAASVPKAKATTLGLYLSAGQAYRKWKTEPRKVKIIDVRTPEESFFVAQAQTLGNEQGIEVFYNRALTPWSLLGFDLQPQLMGNLAAAPACARRRS